MPWKKTLLALPLAVGLALTAGLPAPAADDSAEPDEQALKAAKLGTAPADLAAYLRKQALSDKDRQQVEALVRQLGAEQFAQREEASDKLIALGPPAAPFLREATRSSNLEVSHRAQQCLNEIGTAAADPAILAAAVRLLARKPAEDSVALLLEFFPFCGEEWLEEEVMGALAILGVKAGKPDALLLAALKDPLPARRAAAACVLARRGDLEHRTAVRQMLADPDFKVRSAAARGLLGDRFQRLDVPLSADDRKIVKTSNVTPDAAGLIAFFRARTLSDEARKQLEQYVQDLDSAVFATRQEAAKKLVAAGTPALPFIAAALGKKNGLEMTRRLEACKTEIEKGPGPALPMAAARLLVRRAPPEAVPVLLAYAPFADDGAVEEEVLNCLAQLAVQDPKLPEALLAGLKDELPTRRGVAALALGLVGDKAQVAALKPLLTDDEPRVRLRAAQGLLAARDREAVPVLIGLLDDSPAAVASQAESLLQQLGGEKAPADSINDGTPDARKKGHEAWAAWWRDHGDQFSLADGPQGAAYLGLTLIAELTSNNGTGGNRVYEFGADGKPRWEIKDLQFPIDAHWLRGDHVLVAEYNAQRVLERDRGGKIVWQHKVPGGNPVSCSRLANGNTLIATYTHVMEVTPAGKEVYNHQVSALVNNQQIYNAVKLRSGNIACTTGGTLLIIDQAGKKVKDYMLGNNNFNWSGVEELPGGRFLVAMMGTGKVVEVSADGKEVWSAQVPGCCHAVRLPNGNTLVACMQQQKVLEVNRAGKVVWEKATAGTPFHVRRR